MFLNGPSQWSFPFISVFLKMKQWHNFSNTWMCKISNNYQVVGFELTISDDESFPITAKPGSRPLTKAQLLNHKVYKPKYFFGKLPFSMLIILLQSKSFRSICAQFGAQTRQKAGYMIRLNLLYVTTHIRARI